MEKATVKTCRLCGEEKTLDQYGANSRTRDKLKHECRPCLSEIARLRKKERYNLDSGFREKCVQVNVRSQQKPSGKARRSAWYYTHKERYRNWSMSRKDQVRKATPSWLTPDQKKEISKFHWLARDLEVITGEKYQVDHIVPLQGKEVCGLHVPWNLQVLPSDLNLSKGNRFA